ncbi:MAG: T9SS type A sorting domain-containing protein [Gloeobacteraceae cyanobacterium ES-bin-316]|nr:T9SS type A sorting domain-containing protein [Ferruginibacter sp.]
MRMRSKGSILYKGFAFLASTMMLFAFHNSNAIGTSSGIGKTRIYFSKATKGKIIVQIKTTDNKDVELYLFNAGGELVQKKETNTGDIITLHGVKQGHYLYQCFEKDIQLKSGKLMVNKNSIDYD